MTKKKLKSLLILAILAAVLFGGAIVLRNFLLGQIERRIQAAFNYSRIRLSLLPPAVVFDDVRTVSLSPFFSARRVAAKISFLALFSRAKPLTVFIDQPVLRLSDAPARPASERAAPLFPLPFAVEAGLIRDGEIIYWGRQDSFQVKGVRARLEQKGDEFYFEAESEDSRIVWHDLGQPIEGKLRLEAEGRGRDIRIRRAVLESPGLFFKAGGTLTDPIHPQFNLTLTYRSRIDLAADFFNLPFAWRGEVRGEASVKRENGRFEFRASLLGDDVFLNHVGLEKVDGQVRLTSDEGGTVDLNIRRGRLPDEVVKIRFRDEVVSGTVQGVHLDPIMTYVAVPWPVRTPAWGTFSIDRGKLTARAEFREEDLAAPGELTPFRGTVDLVWDGGNELEFSSESLESSFSKLRVKGDITVGRSVEVTLTGDILDVKEARLFTSRILGQTFEFPEIRGRGTAAIFISGDFASPRIRGDFSCSPGGFDVYDAREVSGTAEIIKDSFLGKFKVEDPALMKGEINLLTSPDGLDAEVQVREGRVEKILPGLGIDLPLNGAASGRFQVRMKGPDLDVEGTFSSPSLALLGLPLENVSTGLTWKDEALTLSRLDFRVYGGSVGGSLSYRVKTQEYDIDLKGQDIDLNAFSPGLRGSSAFNLKGRGMLNANPALGQFSVRDLSYASFRGFAAGGDVEIRSTAESLGLKFDGSLTPGNNRFSVSAEIPFTADPFSVEVKGSLPNPDLFLPWKGVQGQVNYLLEIRGGSPSPKLDGVIDFQGSLLPFPRFAHALTDYSGLVFLQGGTATVRSFQGKLAGGDVQGFGVLNLGRGGVETIRLNVEGKNMLLSPLERTRALTDASLSLVKEKGRLSLEGNVLVRTLSWRRDIFEKISFSSSPYFQTQKEPGFFDDLDLNIRLRAEDNAILENSLGKVRARFDLTLTGNVNDPIVLGDIESLGGEVLFQDRRFRILKGRLNFFNPEAAEPYLDFKGETYVNDYRVTFGLTGLVNELKPEFVSSPPLPPEDVLALLALGESFKRTYSPDTSTQISGASFLSFQLAEEAKKRAEKLFSLDRFRIDPFIMGRSAEMTARLTVGKKVSKNLFILYSTNLTTQREDIVRMEWDLSNELSVVGVRDEVGRISFDIKIRKRF